MRTPVELRPYDADWEQSAAREAERVREALGAEAVEHVGSTAVPGLEAKPIVDVLAGLRSLDLPRDRLDAMERLGYEFLGEHGLPGRLYSRKGSPRSHHVHAVEPGGAHWIRHLALRDYLRADGDEARRYAGEKRRAASLAGGDWDAYCEGKAAYVEALERRALTWREREARP